MLGHYNTYKNYYMLITFSVFDIFSDCHLAFSQYFSGRWYESIPKYGRWFNPDEIEVVECEKCGDKYYCKDYAYGLLTLFFVYLPSCTVMSTIYGCSTTGIIASIWGDIFVVIGCVCWSFSPTVEGGISAWFFGLVGISLIVIGSIGEAFGKEKCREKIERKHLTESKYLVKFFSFPFLLALSPLLMLYIKFQIFLRPTNKLVVNQNKIVCVAEGILEASPQLVLQLFIVLRRFQEPTTGQLLSMITSAFSLTVPSILYFLENRSRRELSTVEKMKKMIKFFPVFFFNMIFRAASLSLFCLFFTTFMIIFLPVYIAILYRFLNLLGSYYNVQHDEEFQHHVRSCFSLNFLTITNLQNSRCAKMCRKVSAYFNIVVYILAQLFILLLCLFHSDIGNIKIPLSGVKWNDLPMAKNKEKMTFYVTINIMIGITSILWDIILQWQVPSQSLSKSVFHSRIKEFRSKSIEKSMSERSNTTELHMFQERKSTKGRSRFNSESEGADFTVSSTNSTENGK